MSVASPLRPLRPGAAARPDLTALPHVSQLLSGFLPPHKHGAPQVFYAPHIEKLSRLALGTHFRPLRYTISQARCGTRRCERRWRPFGPRVPGGRSPLTAPLRPARLLPPGAAQGGTHIRSDVRYDSPVVRALPLPLSPHSRCSTLHHHPTPQAHPHPPSRPPAPAQYGKGWLSAEGRFELAKDGPSAVQLVLESFWVEPGGDDYIAPEGNPTANLAGRSVTTAVVNMLGRLVRAGGCAAAGGLRLEGSGAPPAPVGPRFSLWSRLHLLTAIPATPIPTRNPKPPAVVRPAAGGLSGPVFRPRGERVRLPLPAALEQHRGAAGGPVAAAAAHLRREGEGGRAGGRSGRAPAASAGGGGAGAARRWAALLPRGPCSRRLRRGRRQEGPA